MPSRTMHAEIFRELAAPFDPSEVKSRTHAGRKLHYVTARTVMIRLDEVLGPENWWDHYIPHENSVQCQLTIRLPDGTTVTKEDAGAYAGMPDPGDDDKSGYSDAFKRAAVKHGPGRYLYNDGVADLDDGESAPAARHDSRPAPESLPSQARPPYANGGESRQGGNAPRTGRALFAWAKDMEAKHGEGLIKYLNQWGKLQDFPGRLVDWDEEQAKLGHAEASRKIEGLQGESVPSAPAGPVESANGAEFPEPSGDVPRPAKGSELYQSAKDWEQRLKVSLIPSLIEFGRERGIPGRVAEWSGDGLDLGWRFLSTKVAGKQAASPADPSIPLVAPANLAVVAKAKRLLKMIVVGREVTRDDIAARINQVYGSMYRGDVIDDFRSFADADRLAELAKCFDELIAEQEHEPA